MKNKNYEIMKNQSGYHQFVSPNEIPIQRFITTPLTTGRLPSQRLDPALPKLFWFTPTFPTCPTVAEQFLDIKRTSPEGKLGYRVLATVWFGVSWYIRCFMFVQFEVAVREILWIEKAKGFMHARVCSCSILILSSFSLGVLQRSFSAVVRVQNNVSGLNLCVNSCFHVGIDVVIVVLYAPQKEKILQHMLAVAEGYFAKHGRLSVHIWHPTQPFLQALPFWVQMAIYRKMYIIKGEYESQGDLRNEKQSETKQKHFLRGSEYVVTYVEKDDDWMLLGDVPWDSHV
ncbi:hypothetical protein CTI12_AA511860 [Artemisia annua]|uniref:Auxin-responsive protein n=1 Tax=Artemisia annua TaxID=35608 RepID=A0A2U1LAX2_ARTAN|nr:hypothetical protein CTI12_AA511860 [Artemisia annua]